MVRRFWGWMLAAALVLLAGCGAAAAPAETPLPTVSPAAEETPAPALPTETPEPEETPAPVPAPEETPAPTPEPTPPPIREKNDAYFDGGLFIGDSILEGVRQYVAANRGAEPLLGDAKFLTSVYGIAVSDLVGDRDWGRSYVWQGAPMALEDIVGSLEVRRFFLFLGLNDLEGEDPVDVDLVVERYFRLIAMLREWKSDAEILVMTIPPKVASDWLPDYTENRHFGNPLIDEFVARLTEECESQGVPVIDIHTALSDETGAMPLEYCGDGFIHLNEAGRRAVVDALYQYARDKGD